MNESTNENESTNQPRDSQLAEQRNENSHVLVTQKKSWSPFHKQLQVFFQAEKVTCQTKVKSHSQK